MKTRFIVVVALFTMGTAMPAAAARLRVPQDFATVSAAVAAAASGDTVEVQGGPYIEQVVINKSIKLVGKPTGVIKAPPAMIGSKAIITVTGVGVSATIQKLTITGPGDSGCNSLRWGIRVEAGAHAIIRNNDILEIRDQPISGCQNGVGIMVGLQSEGTAGTATIEKNYIAGFQKNGMIVSNVGSSAWVDGNLVQGAGPVNFIAQNGIQVSAGAVGHVLNNTVRNMRYTPQTVADGGILIFSAGAGTEVSCNLVENVDVGIWFYATTGASITSSTSTGSTYDGIVIQSSSGNAVKDNLAEANSQGGPAFGAGIGLYGATNNTIAGNRARSNLDDGFYADAGSTGNLFKDNKANKNGAFGYHDLSVGTGTGGTANTYKRNTASGNTAGDSSPAGIAQ